MRSGLTDAQCKVLEPRAREVMKDLTVAVGRPMVHDLGLGLASRPDK
jgi:hypothetical protein